MKKLDTAKMAQESKELKPPKKKADWRVEVDYSYTDNLSLKGWAWEAIRRYKPYRKAFKESDQDSKARKTIAKKYHLKDLYDPSLSYDEGVGFIRESYPILLHIYDECETHIGTHTEHDEGDEENAAWESPLHIVPDQAVVIFDLTKNIPDQLKHAEHLIEERQELFGLKKTAKEKIVLLKKGTKELWRRHLRVLDALEGRQKISKAEIGRVICKLEERNRAENFKYKTDAEIGSEIVNAAKEFPVKYKAILSKAFREERVRYRVSESK